MTQSRSNPFPGIKHGRYNEFNRNIPLHLRPMTQDQSRLISQAINASVGHTDYYRNLS